MMNKMSIKKDDTVVVITGKDKGQRGKVLTVIPKEGKVVVEKINLVSRHTKPRKQGDEGGIIQLEAPCMQGDACLPQVRDKPTAPPARWWTPRRSVSASTAALKSERGRSHDV